MKESINQTVEIATNMKLGFFAGILAVTSDWWRNFGEAFFSMVTVILGSVLLIIMIIGHFYKILETHAKTKKLNADIARDEKEEYNDSKSNKQG